MSKPTGKPLRFASLIRVSTEKQERKGESLRTQATQIEQSVELTGEITERYGGQEHGTAGWERQQLGKLLEDAVKSCRPFDAVIVADATRWSRDNIASEAGLATLRDAGVRFFVLGTEYDLFNPEQRLFLSLASTIGAYHAQSQAKKSIENKIERAKRGYPTSGKLPFARLWDAEKKLWTIDPKKHEMIQDIAERFLAGESMPKLSQEYQQNHSNLIKILKERCGDRWEMEFESKKLNIHETVPLTVPRLLPEKTIKAICQRLVANRTYMHKPPKGKHSYLLGGRIFCDACGYTMTGKENEWGKFYYRHRPNTVATVRKHLCPLKPGLKPYIRAEKIEQAVLLDLFNTFGNPAALERAIKAAVPDCDKIMKRRDHLQEELAKTDRARNRVLDLIDKDSITDAQAGKKLGELKDREAELRSELDKIAVTLANVPDQETLRLYVETTDDGAIIVHDGQGNFTNEDGSRFVGGNNIGTWLLMHQNDPDGKDRRALIDAAFGSPLPDGKPAGVYIGRNAQGQITYEIRGCLISGRPHVLSRQSKPHSTSPFCLFGVLGTGNRRERAVAAPHDER